MKTLLWFDRNEKPAVQITLSVESAEWLLDQLDRGDTSHRELFQAIEDARETVHEG